MVEVVFKPLVRIIRRLGPYASLLLLAIPFCIVEPVKILAMFKIANGNWLLGTTFMVAAYAVSALVVERLFKLVKSKILRIGWFETLWNAVNSVVRTLFQLVQRNWARRLRRVRCHIYQEGTDLEKILEEEG